MALDTVTVRKNHAVGSNDNQKHFWVLSTNDYTKQSNSHQQFFPKGIWKT